MSSLASSMEFERRKFTILRANDFQRTSVKREVCTEHDEFGETALYPLSPLSLTLYYAFDTEVE